MSRRGVAVDRRRDVLPNGHATSGWDRETRGRHASSPDGARVSLGRLAIAVVTVAYVFLVFVEAVLSIVFVLRLLGSDASTTVGAFVSRIADHFARPFRGVVEPVQLRWLGVARTSVADVELLLAMIVYGIAAAVIRATNGVVGGQPIGRGTAGTGERAPISPDRPGR
jgi:hypothetical protein